MARAAGREALRPCQVRRGAPRCGVVWCEAVRRAWTILSSMACWAAGSMPLSAGAITLMMFSTAFATPLPMYAPWAAAGRQAARRAMLQAK